MLISGYIDVKKIDRQVHSLGTIYGIVVETCKEVTWEDCTF